MYIYIYIYLYVCMYVCMYVCVCIYIYIYMYVYIYIYTIMSYIYQSYVLFKLGFNKCPNDICSCNMASGTYFEAPKRRGSKRNGIPSRKQGRSFWRVPCIRNAPHEEATRRQVRSRSTFSLAVFLPVSSPLSSLTSAERLVARWSYNMQQHVSIVVCYFFCLLFAVCFLLCL